MARNELDRRTFLHVAGVAGVTALAGCSGGEADDDTTTTEAPAETEDGSGGGDRTYLDEEPDYGGYLDEANNYEGTVDWRENEEVTVRVGADDGLAFDPAAVAISSGTTVTWEWTGQGGDHNVENTEGDFESELVGTEGHTFSYTFEEAGTYTYFCSPHEQLDMKGGVYVE